MSATAESLARTRRIRLLKDRLARYFMGIGGVGVIVAIALIFFYLLKVVAPLFMPAGMEQQASYPLPGGTEARTLYLAMEEQNEIGLRVLASGELLFFRVADGRLVSRHALPIPPGEKVTSFSVGDQTRGTMVFGLSNGEALFVRHIYKVTYPDDQRLITPALDFPLGEEPQRIDSAGMALVRLAAQDGEDEATVVAQTEDGRLLLSHFMKEESLFGDELSLEQETHALDSDGFRPDYLLLGKEQRALYMAKKDGRARFYDVSDKSEPELLQALRLTDGTELTSLRFLAGHISLLVADAQGRIRQWFPVRDDNNRLQLHNVRGFAAQHAAIDALAAEYYRKGFLAADRSGRIGIYHTTSERVLRIERLSEQPLRKLAIAPRASALLAEDGGGQMHVWTIDNEHPEVSWQALWGKVWYESYPEPEYVWQSSSASNDFEPKLSLTPLAFGTLKAAFYAMLLAMPLAIAGAVYTAYFMAPRMRRMVKPSIEIMEALPTVILGFLAGLWLAPAVEDNLPGIFAMLLIVPFGVLLFGYCWQLLPRDIRNRLPEGWDAALLIPVVGLLGWLGIALSPLLENAFFGGDMRHWLNAEMGIGFDQRNSLVVGLAMGFAVIPTIFSMTEDAIFSVPKHLRNGSLALGATQWQTLTRVVLLTASPGIFAAVMIGFGRAVGETMIVLMATGNTAVMDFSIFEGMRTLSANIAVEMPESEVGSTHYRVLFLAALVLFVFTFLFNTAGEMVRQRLRDKYGKL